MNLYLRSAGIITGSEIKISGSKSETNRMLLLRALYPELSLENVSVSDDSEVMRKALSANEGVADIHHAGTAMRFLTAYFAIREGKTVTLTGSPRMQERPIKILVEALRQLGAEIDFLANDGFPPIRITGKKITKNNINLKADVSSQFISALLLIAPKLENGLELVLEGDITSVPYIKMTLSLLHAIGVETSFEENTIRVRPKPYISPSVFSIESDWSSASYYYSIVALSKVGTSIRLSNYKQQSFQGDRALAEIYTDFAVATTFNDNDIVLTKTGDQMSTNVGYQLNDTPDIAQTIAVTCFGLGIGCGLSGLHTLKIKETDRLEALKSELTKLGAEITVTNNSLALAPATKINPDIKIKTYNDHRMAMAFAPLALKVPVIIEDAGVVSKSYPDFWKDLKRIGFEIETA